MRGALATAVTLTGLLAFATPGEAQWVLGAQAGRLRNVPGAVPAADGVLGLGLQYSDRVGGFRAAVGLPVRAQEPYWGTLGGWVRLAHTRAGFAVGLDLSGQGTMLRDRDGGLREVPGLLGPRLEPVPVTAAYTIGGEGLPLLAYEAGRVRVQARAGVARLWVVRGETRGDRTVPLGDLQLTVLVSNAIAIAPVVRRFHEPDDRVSDYVGATAVIAGGPVSFRVNMGHWMGVLEAETPWSANATIQPVGRLLLTAGARHDGYDPISRQPPQTSFSISAGIRLGRAPLARVTQPVPVVGRDGRSVIRLSVAESPASPRIAGDFTGWSPQPMQREGAHWTFEVSLAPGVYQYAFVAADGTWFVPESVPGRRSDGMGGQVAVLVVP